MRLSCGLATAAKKKAARLNDISRTELFPHPAVPDSADVVHLAELVVAVACSPDSVALADLAAAVVESIARRADLGISLNVVPRAVRADPFKDCSVACKIVFAASATTRPVAAAVAPVVPPAVLLVMG